MPFIITRGAASAQAFGFATTPIGSLYWAGVLSSFSASSGFPFMTIDSSANIYIVGVVSDGCVNSPAFVKISSSGTVLSQNDYAYSSAHNAPAIALTSSGNIALLSNDASGPYPNGYPLVLDSSFNVSVAKTVTTTGGVGGGNSTNCLSMAIDSSGNIYLCGQWYSASSGHFNGLFIKLTSAGALSFANYVGTSLGGGLYTITLDSSGIPYIGGTIYDAAYKSQFFISKITTSGARTWQATYQHIICCCGTRLDSAQCQGVVVDSSGNVIGVGNASNGSLSYGVLMSFSSTGTLNWQRQLNGSYTINLEAVALDSSNNIYAVGLYATSPWYIVIVKYNSSGTIQWQRTINCTSSSINLNGLSISIDNASNTMFIGAEGPSGTSNNMLFRLPTDGSHTGSFSVGGQTYSYASSSFTDSSGILSTGTGPGQNALSGTSSSTSTPTKGTASASTLAKVSL
jgi:hypothetical protein